MKSTIEQYSEQDFKIKWDEEKVSDFWDKKIQYNQKEVHKNSCSIHWPIWCISDLMDYEFSLSERKEIRNLALQNWASTERWRYLNDAVNLVRNRWYEKKYTKLETRQVELNTNDMLDVLKKGYSIATWYRWNSAYNKDMIEDCILNWIDFWESTYWHCIRIFQKDWHIYVVDNYKWRECNYYKLEDFNKLYLNSVYFRRWYIYLLKDNQMTNIILPEHPSVDSFEWQRQSTVIAWEQEMPWYVERGWKFTYNQYKDLSEVDIIVRMLIDLNNARR